MSDPLYYKRIYKKIDNSLSISSIVKKILVARMKREKNIKFNKKIFYNFLIFFLNKILNILLKSFIL
jgi:hypothetical protein